MIIEKFIQWFRSGRYYIIADPEDNSVTLSKHLFNHLKGNAQSNDAKVFVFSIPENKSYGFTVDHRIEQPTQLCDIQYNDKYRCIGFETLCPSVGTIFYHYGLPVDKKVKMSVTVHKTADRFYYQIENPHAKHPWNVVQKG